MSALLKVCGMKDPANIGSLTKLGPDYMGFIMYPGSKRFIANLDPSVILNIPDEIKTTGVFVNEEIEVVLDALQTYGFRAVQLHGKESPDYCSNILGRAEVIKAFGIDEEFDFSKLQEYEGKVDYFLFDTQTAQHGGSGRKFNWDILGKYTLNVPYFLSGGIGPDDAAALLRFDDHRCYAIDINSKFELAPGLKDIDKISAFKHSGTGVNNRNL